MGPVPSRRLGRSLGVNPLPGPKACTYSCVYCQAGRTARMTLQRRAFHDVDAVVADVAGRMAATRDVGERVDYVAVVPDGEPTLDRSLGDLLRGLKGLGPPVAVITNGSLLWRPDVREDLNTADWVSVKVDAVDEAVWRRVDRPHGRLGLAAVLEGLNAFAAGFPGVLVSETMLVAGVNDGEGHLARLADVLAGLRPRCAYVSVPSRPPAEAWVRPPKESVLNAAYQVLAARLPRVELLTGYEGDSFVSTGDPAADVLGITAVHPMREDAVRALLRRSGAEDDVLRPLLDRGDLVVSVYRGQRYYVRAVEGRRAAPGGTDG